MENHFIFDETKNIKGIVSFTTFKTLLIVLLIAFTFGVCLSNGKVYATDDVYSVKIDVFNNDGKIAKTNTIFVDEKIDEKQIEKQIFTQLKKGNTKLVDADFSDDVNITVESVVKTDKTNVIAKRDVARHILSSKLADVVTVEKETKLLKTLNYKTVVKKTSKLRKTVNKVKRRGKKGKITSSKYITKLSGAIVKISAPEKKKVAPVNKIIHRGTGSVNVYSGKMYSGTRGKDIVKFAKKFLGNPYRYGGTSLTKGADCSGFVYSIYRHHGLKVPRVGQTSVGKRVSVKKLRPGDVVRYSGHMAIYIGNGKVIHALNRRKGICISSLHYVGKPLKASRIVRN